MKMLSAIGLFVVFLATETNAQVVCSTMPSRAQVQSAVMNRGGVGTSDVIYSCLSYSDYNQKIFDTMTAYSERFYLDYVCNATAGWDIASFNIDVAGNAPASRDAGTCTRCFNGASSPGHCQPCTGECYICASSLCYVCDEGYDLGAGNICRTSNVLTTDIIVVIVVCVILALIFIVLLLAALGLVIYIVKFTKTEEIAHRRMRDDRGPVSYQRRSQIDTFRQNPVFGAEGTSWSSQDQQQQPEGGWSNPLAQPKTKRPALTTLDTKEAQVVNDDDGGDSEGSFQDGDGEEDGGYEI